jgi:hypothetical protein
MLNISATMDGTGKTAFPAGKISPERGGPLLLRSGGKPWIGASCASSVLSAKKRQCPVLVQFPHLLSLVNLVFQGQAEVQKLLGILKGDGLLSSDRNGLEMLYSEEIPQSETVSCPGKSMDDISKRDLLLTCRTDTENLNASVALVFLGGDSGLHCFFSPEMICLFKLDLSVVNPKIDGSLRLSLDDALVKTCCFQRGPEVTGHLSKAIDRNVRER